MHELYAQARQLLAGERWAEALPLLDALIADYPEVPQLRVAAGQCRQRLLLGNDLLSNRGLNQKRYQRWITYGEQGFPDPLLPLRHDWWELIVGAGGSVRFKPLHGGRSQPADTWPRLGWLCLRHPACVLRPGALQMVERWLYGRTSAGSAPDVLYADEDQLSPAGERCDPWFKPGFTLESFWSSPWLEGLSLWRLSWLRTKGLGFPPLDQQARWLWLLQALKHKPCMEGLPYVLSHWQSHHQQITGEQASWRADQLAMHLQEQGEALRAATPHPQHPGCFQLQWAMPAVQRCCIVIPTRDRAELLDACLESVWRTRGLANAAVDISFVVVDNGSEEEATQALFSRWRLKLGDRFAVLPDPRQFNWSALNNAAAATSNAELLLFLNNDIEALESGWLEAMAAQALRVDVGCAGAVLLYPDHTIQHAGVVVGMHGGADHAYAGLPYPCAVHRGRPQLLTAWGAVTGACLMVRRLLFEQVGGFDEAFPVEFNDIDFCLRLQQLGYRHVVVPEAVLLHYESQSRDAKASQTAADALKRLQSNWNPRLSHTAPWWPPSSAPHWADGRPVNLEYLL